MLDFTTLYVIILLNSVSFTIIWIAISTSYRSVVSARYWLSALVMTSISGPLLVWGEGIPITNYIGMTLVAGSFALYWQGLRVFSGRPANLKAVGLIMVGSFALMLIFGGKREVNNIIFATSQALPIFLAIGTLLRGSQRYLGRSVTIAAATIMVAGQGAEATTNLFQLVGLMSIKTYYSIAAWFVVCSIIGGGILNLGFLIMTMDWMRDELKQLATRDDLTGLPNRRGFRETLTNCETLITRRSAPAVLMMIDLDKFKAINDNFGHAAGDAALVHIAEIARGILRDEDVICRLGGDEFCVLLPSMDLDDASFVAERLNTVLTANPLLWKGQQVALSASIGLSEWRPGSPLALADCLDNADSALLEAKRGGRNGHTIHGARLALS